MIRARALPALRLLPGLVSLLVLTACGSAAEQPSGAQGQTAPAAQATPPAPPAPPAVTAASPAPDAPAPQIADIAEYSSKDCATVVRRYTAALRAREFAVAALAWADPATTGDVLQARFAGYRAPQIALQPPVVEGAAGSLYCTVTGSLTDADDPGRPASAGELQLRRVNDVDGATPSQLRWTIRSSTFPQPTQRTPAR